MADRQYLKVKAAYLYYVMDQRQADIARRLGISRPTLIRLLQEARAEGVVRIEIAAGQMADVELEVELAAHLGIEDVLLAPSAEGRALTAGLARRLADYIHSNVKSDMQVGVSWGRTLQAAMEYLEPAGVYGVSVVPLLGGPHKPGFSGSIAERLASRYPGGSAANLYAPMLAADAQEARRIRETRSVAETLARIPGLDMAIMGIDGDVAHSSAVEGAGLSAEDVECLRQQGAVGTVCTRFFDAGGVPLAGEIDARVIGATAEDIRRIPVRVAAGGGPWKRESIVSGAKGGFFNVLITDEATAREILHG